MAPTTATERRRRARRASSALAVALLLAAGAAAAPFAATQEQWTTVAHWPMNESRGDPVLRDVSDSGLNGRTGDDVVRRAVHDGAVAHRYRYVEPNTSPVNPRRIDRVGDDARLDPDEGDFAVTVRLRTTTAEGNIIQKGQSGTPGGFWKMDVANGTVFCLFRGASGSRGVWSRSSVADGRWHTVRCERTGGTVRMLVDGVVQSTNRGATGRIANTSQLTIAGKASCNQVSVGCDYFSGDIDSVRIQDDSIVK